MYVKHRNLFYKLIRKLFLNKSTIKVRADWKEPVRYNTYYQEDCMLMFEYEIKCIQTFEKEVACAVSLEDSKFNIGLFVLKKLVVSLYNIQLIFNNGLTFTIPISFIETGIRRNEIVLNSISNAQLVEDSLKFHKYKGEYFKRYVKDNNITSWVPVYCSLCSKPLEFNFHEDKIIINNKCDCGLNKFNMNEMSYNEFALWYANQVTPIVKKRYNEFWFKKR